MSKRRRSRETVLQMLFQLEATGADPQEVLSSYTDAFGEGPQPDEFSATTFLAIARAQTALDTIITTASDNWRLERMSRVDRNILRIGSWELNNTRDTPAKVVINEAVELAKRFGADESPSFVNGILDRIARETSQLE